MAVNAGRMRHQITIQTQSTTLDSAGQPLDSWSTFATVRAAVERTPGREFFASAQRNGRIPVVFRLRYLDGVTAAMRVVFDSKVHNITSPPVDQSGLGEELVLVCEEQEGEAP